MKRLIGTFFVVFAFLYVAAASMADTAIPTQAQQALDRALADPPVNVKWLCEVYTAPQVAQYMAHAPIVIDLGAVKMYFSDSSGITLVKEKCSIQVQPLEEGALPDCFKLKDDRESSCCSQMQMELSRYRQSDFWSAFATAVAPKQTKK